MLLKYIQKIGDCVKVVLLGPGDISKIWRYTEISEEEVRNIIIDFGKFLAENKFEVVLVPSRGIHYEIAKVYKEAGGPKVIGVVPKGDKRFGIRHIEEHLPIADEVITRIESVSDKEINWYDLNGEIASMGDVAVCFGISSGALIDMAMLYYHYKYLGSTTPLLVLKPFVEGNIPKPIEDDLKYMEYAENVEDLKTKLLNYRKAQASEK